MLDEIALDRLRGALDRLPRFEPSDTLWPRIVAARATPVRRKPVWAIAATLAALALAGSLFVARQQPGPEPRLAAHVAQARSLEAELAAARGVRVANPDVLSLERELAVVDVALQSAYDERATPDELEILWRARTERLAALLVAYRHAATLVRI
ncbi:MAG TPA: hypothetical protein VND91_10885 [Candidatus Saccharimonadia bacterium]|nr:hypothetical protein [Candidatus Saccharimonadia bacterium]